jgi:hypothetical protein
MTETQTHINNLDGVSEPAPWEENVPLIIEGSASGFPHELKY